MLDYQRIVDDVRAAMATSADLIAEDVLRQPAADFTAACVEANERLRQCGSLLNQGLRSEAIQLAEIEPNLLDLVAALDFPERGQWDALLTQCGMKTAPRLNLEVAGELNEAYAQEQPLTVLLQRHRLLALAKGTLRSRIEVLRQLAEVDPQNLVWEEDLATFEQERFKQIQREAAEAGKARDVSTLNALLDELKDPAWREPPPEALVSRVSQWAANLGFERTLSILQNLEPQLNDAFSSLDVDDGRRLREAWFAHANSLPNSCNGSLHARVAPALQWLAEEDKKESLRNEHLQYKAALERALDEEKPAAELERYYHAAVRHGHELPDVLERRYQQRIEDLDLASRRKSRLILACVLGVLLISAGLVGLVVYNSMRARAIDAAVASVERLLSEDMLAEAREYLDRLDANAPAVAKSSEVQAARARLEGMERDEGERRTRVANRLELIASGLPTPTPGLVEEARKLVKLESERSQLLAMEAKIATHERNERIKDEAEFQKDCENILKRLEGLAPARFASAAEYSAALASVRSQSSSLQDKHPKIGQDLRAQIQILLDRIAKLQETAKAREIVEGREAAVDRTIGDVVAYRAALQDLARQDPDSVRSKDIQRVLAESPYWEAWKAVADWTADAGKATPGSATPAEAARAVATLKALLEKHFKYPVTEPLREWRLAMEAVARRAGRSASAADSLKPLFQDLLVARAWVVVDSENRRYYVPEEPVFDTEKIVNIAYYVDFTFKKKGTFLKPGEITYQGTAPQSEIAAVINPLLESLKDDNWDETMLQIVEAIVKGKTKVPMDPLLRRSLLKRTLETASQGSAAFAKVFAPYLQQVQASKIADSANWVDPRASDVVRLREDAERELATLPDLATLGTALQSEGPRMRGLAVPQIRWIGWMRRSGDAWRYWPGDPPVRNAKLLVLREKSGSGQTVWESLGEVRSGKLQLSSTAADAHVEGRPVFAE